MLDFPGYTLVGAIRSASTHPLLHAVRDADGLRLSLKTPVSLTPGPRECARYRQEYGILQRLREVRGVIRALGYEEHEERPALLLEEVTGSPLSELLDEPFPVERVLELAIRLASILEGVHRCGVIHKDLKPSNILITPDGDACLIDFGIATLQAVEHVDAAPPTLIEGTLAYMSPEQTGRMNRAVDYRSDFYSLGILLYELLTGRRPFQGKDALEWFHAHLALSPQPPHEHSPTIPPVLSAIVMKLLAKLAEERYQSAEGLRADLERCRKALSQGVVEDFALGQRDTPSRFQLPQRFYGRDAQVAALHQAFERVAREERPELMLVSGYSGIGKSSLVSELHKPVVRQRGFFLTCKFDQFQQDVPLSTMAQALRALTQQLLAGTDEELARWRERLRQALEGQGQLLLDVVPQLELVVGRQPPAPELPPLDAQKRFNRLLQKFLGVFSTPQHPLVVFLDDLQWADLASLRLLQFMFTHPDTPPLLAIGAYRENEVSPSHPLVQALTELREAGALMSDIHLEALNLQQVQQLVADTLPGAEQAVVGPLSALVYEKTGGNPFFLIQLMTTLVQDGLLVRTPEGRWRWDADGVRAREYSDNVVDFMVSKLRQLPLRTQQLLQLASCAGGSFSLHLLVIISGMPPVEVESGLEQALQEGMLVRAEPEQYRFLHDRIQQAAYALIPESERKAVHLRIGRMLLASLSPEEVREKLFDVVGQLNAGAGLITEPAERLRLARLNAEAGWKASSSTAFRSAVTFFRTAFELLPGDPWETDRELAFKVQLDRGRNEFMSGGATETRRLVGELQLRARSRAEMAAVYRLKSDIHLAANEGQEALTSLLECLARFGMPMSASPTWEEVTAANEEVVSLLGERPIASLVALPLMTDPEMKAVMDVLSALFMPAFISNFNLLVLHLCRMVSLSLRHGNSEASVNGYAWYGLMQGVAFKRYAQGYAFGELASALVERHSFTSSRGRVLYSLELINYWTRPISRSLELIRSAFQHALQAGDFQVACYCSTHIVTDRLALGHSLDEVYQESVVRLDFLHKAGYPAVRDSILHTQRYVQQLRGLSRSFDTLSGDDFDEAAFEAGLTPRHHSTMQCWYWILKMQSRFMCGAYEQAREAGTKAGELLWSCPGHIQQMDFHLFHALTLAACYRGAQPREQSRYLEVIREHEQQLEEWASHCSENFRAPERMVSAELARITGRTEEALRTYEEAIFSARAYGFIQNVGLASELAARFWYERQAPTVAEVYARQSWEAWVQWGARGKARHMAAQWPHLVSVTAFRGSLSDVSSTQLEAHTLAKAQQAVSGELSLSQLTTTVVRVALETTSARWGALLLPQGDSLTVAALSGAAPVGSADRTVEENLPWALLTYVRRTREHVLLSDTSQPHPFSADSWLGRGQARSVLCLPLMRGEEFHGLLYLENDLTPRAFTAAHLSLLGHLAEQAAISLENARRHAELQRSEVGLRRAHDELKQRLEERTWELQKAQTRPAEAPRDTASAEMAASMLHNVGNVLTSAIVNLQTVREQVEASRVSRVKQVAAMIDEHRADLADFLTQDPQGGNLPAYLSSLAEELLREHSALKDGTRELNKQIEHLRAIIQVQQAYARSSLLPEECDLSRIIEDALSIQMPMLQRHGVQVTQELGMVPKVRLDKHRVLQILINLISNARSALSGLPVSQRKLHVRLTANGSTARIEVVDTGKGIAPEHREQLFSRGFTTREDGQGLGLHSSVQAAKTLGGKLTLESEGLGKGATAMLELPLA
ncbi:trifunctional serine/threonine-protein kinase/ATP-binding protein/sensor histidine kinase [Hyalangium versicolor]|uniref:trifunctional serine/threonine-protein kinase/ATP-binding protein/sensor histidine kinase n=1 Tax=Hyalangium versicolor TaxID=2861190 RepID=UPI001CD03ED8|nr:trifunctional serine/threonine-protein kinase/ATP-binding protein/sensor histidine kinase [Hyalangium versicolor]